MTPWYGSSLFCLQLCALGLAACTVEPNLNALLERDSGSDDDDDDDDDADLDAGVDDDDDEGDGGSTRRDACTLTSEAATSARNVDLLFMIDNSGSMAEEQKKLNAVLPKLVRTLALGTKDGRTLPGDMQPDFPPVESLHIGVVSSDMGINGAPSMNSCGDRSFIPTDKDPVMSTQRINKPVGDDGILQISTAVATAGIFGPSGQAGVLSELVAADPSCANVVFPPNERFVNFTAGGDTEAAAHRFSCVARLGRNGCGLEQQLEATLKALTPPDSQIKFTAMSPNGHGNALKASVAAGYNQNFLRDDAILAVILISDEEDCSIPDLSRPIFDGTSSRVPGSLNVRCGLRENAALLHPVSRYVDGLKALKPAGYEDRVIFAAAVGIPLAPNTGAKVHSGASAMDKLLARPDMQFLARRNANNTDDEPVPVCISEAGDGAAAPGRRYLELARAFGDQGTVTSICEDEYQSLLTTVVDSIAKQLKQAPRPAGCK